jgi:hypothetical protein
MHGYEKTLKRNFAHLAFALGRDISVFGNRNPLDMAMSRRAASRYRRGRLPELLISRLLRPNPQRPRRVFFRYRGVQRASSTDSAPTTVQNTITLANNLNTSGNFGLTLTATATTNSTLPACTPHACGSRCRSDILGFTDDQLCRFAASDPEIDRGKQRVSVHRHQSGIAAVWF